VTPPADAATTRRLLAALAALPSEDAPAGWAGGLGQVVTDIRTRLADDRDGDTVPFTTLLGWRTELDTQLAVMRQADPARWERWRTPATWLDSVLRLRSVISHVVGKAYWDEVDAVRFADIDVERYLWGAR
jgi:hypothetical protein